MISVEEARERLLALVKGLEPETVPLRAVAGRVLAAPVTARHDQPPFAASAMDGWAVAAETPVPGDRFRIVGEAAAGRPHEGRVRSGEAVRIFTGGVVPEGAVRIVIQEDARRDGGFLEVVRDAGAQTHVRPAGGDFRRGDPHAPGRPLGSRDVALLAAMGRDALSVVRRPVVAILMTGDELRPPGTPLGRGQITASNGYGLAAALEAMGAVARLLPIARDNPESLAAAIALAEGADLLLTIGGASVGDHDLIASALDVAGMDLSFHKVAMRPGKPLMAGSLGSMAVVGLPGNPVSALVCGQVFVRPMIRRMLGLPSCPAPISRPLGAPLEANGPRQHYMRAKLRADGSVEAAERQDSSLLRVLAEADCLIVRPPGDPARAVGDAVPTLDLGE